LVKRPHVLGFLKFHNKSEEERYTNVCMKILRMEYQDEGKVRMAYEHVYRYL
jgi:hypothetical protein